MKTHTRVIAPLIGVLSVALPLMRADHPEKLRVLAEAQSPDTQIEHRVFARHGPGPGEREMETVPFLGVETTPVTPALTAQLGLPKDAGLVVRHIVPDSPAAAVLQTHDILLKLDDQLLIDPRQFSVLVRNHKEGDEVELTYVRGGKQNTTKVKLGKHEAPKMAFDFPDENFGFFVQHADGAGLPREELDRELSLLDREHHERAPFPPGARMTGPEDPGFHSVTVNTGNSNMVYNDEQGSLELTLKDGKKTLLAKDAKGTQLFSGPIDTPEQRKALPENVHQRLDRLEGMQNFSFHVGDDFQSGDVKVVRPVPTKIRMPLSQPPIWSAEIPPTI